MIMLHTTEDGRVPAFLRLPAAAITPKSGLLLKQEDGLLDVAAGDDEPEYICITEAEEAVAAGDEITVAKIYEEYTFETETPEEFDVDLGAKVQIAEDGLGITATEGGACEIVKYDDERVIFRIAAVDAVEEG